MIRDSFRRLALIGLSFTMAIAISPAPVAAQATPAGGKTLVGAWFNTVTPTLAPPFVGLGVFSADGGATNISSVSLGSPLESPGYGQWIKTGAHSYAVTFFTIVADSAGQHILTYKVRGRLELSASGDAFTGTFQVDVFLPNGMPLGSDTGTVTGTRIVVEPLP